MPHTPLLCFPSCRSSCIWSWGLEVLSGKTLIEVVLTWLVYLVGCEILEISWISGTTLPVKKALTVKLLWRRTRGVWKWRIRHLLHECDLKWRSSLLNQSSPSPLDLPIVLVMVALARGAGVAEIRNKFLRWWRFEPRPFDWHSPALCKPDYHAPLVPYCMTNSPDKFAARQSMSNQPESASLKLAQILLILA